MQKHNGKTKYNKASLAGMCQKILNYLDEFLALQ